MARPCVVTWGSFVAGALRELSIGKGDYFMHCACIGELPRLTGQSFRTGMTVPTDEPLV